MADQLPCSLGPSREPLGGDARHLVLQRQVAHRLAAIRPRAPLQRPAWRRVNSARCLRNAPAGSVRAAVILPLSLLRDEDGALTAPRWVLRSSFRNPPVIWDLAVKETRG